MLGFILGLGCVLAAIAWEGSQLSHFIRLPVLVLVLGGSLGATLTSHSPRQVWKAFMKYRQMKDLQKRALEVLPRLARYAGIVRHQGALKLDGESKKEPEPIVARALDALADGADAEEIEALTEACVAEDMRGVEAVERFYESLGGACPTFGLIGTVIGLVTMLAGQKHPDLMSQGISSSFVATFYGMMLANILFLPLAAKAREVAKEYERFTDNLVLGIGMVQAGTAPRTLLERLRGPLGLSQTPLPTPEVKEVKTIAKRIVQLAPKGPGSASPGTGSKKSLG